MCSVGLNLVATQSLVIEMEEEVCDCASGWTKRRSISVFVRRRTEDVMSPRQWMHFLSECVLAFYSLSGIYIALTRIDQMEHPCASKSILQRF